MLPSFRLASAGSEEDLADPESTVGGSLEEPSTPANTKPFKLSDTKLIDYASSKFSNLII